MPSFAVAIALLCLPVLSAFAADPTSSQSAVLAELAWRSGTREAELPGLLANCSASTQSLYLCAWRDQIVIDRELGAALAEKAQRKPECRATLEVRIADWAKARDTSCDRAAFQRWGEGPIAPTARLRCVADETARMTARLTRSRRCDLQ